MQKQRANLLRLIFLGFIVASSNGLAANWEWWPIAGADYQLNPDWHVKLEEQGKFNDDGSDAYYYHTDLSLAQKISDRFELSYNIRHIDEKIKGDWKEEIRPHISGTFKWSGKTWRMEDRNRVEWRIRQDRDDIVRYRNRLQLFRPISIDNHEFEPYIGEEAFIDSDAGDFNQFRTSAGVKTKLGKNLKLDLYYLWQATDKKDGWIDANVAGTSLYLLF